MKRFCLLLMLLGCCGCVPAAIAIDYRDAAAIELGIASLAGVPAPQPVPTPEKCLRCKGTGWLTHGDGHRTPCPHCSAKGGQGLDGPLGTLLDAKELIRKGNDLADRGRILLDTAERDGKITVDVQLPKPASLPSAAPPGPQQTCPGGVCPAWPQNAPPAGSRPQGFPPPVDGFALPSTGAACEGGACRPRLWWRPRR